MRALLLDILKYVPNQMLLECFFLTPIFPASNNNMISDKFDRMKGNANRPRHGLAHKIMIINSVAQFDSMLRSYLHQPL
jgi:hypothetical protein